MSRKLVSLFLALALLASCVPAFAEDGVTVTDMTGREITLDGPAAKIVALTASDVEIIYALGAGDLLVGRGEWCNWPAEVLDKPVVKSGAETVYPSVTTAFIVSADPSFPYSTSNSSPARSSFVLLV